MSFNNLSPVVNIREIDLTNFIPSVGTSAGAFVGNFVWGPVFDHTIISDSNRLVAVHGKPTDVNYVDWYSVSNFLSYTNTCFVVRATHDVAGVSTAFNSISKSIGSSPNSGITINNDADFSANFGVSSLYEGKNFAARYPGKIGNTLKVMVIDSASWVSLDDDWKGFFDGPPGTSEYAAALGGSNDEVHILIVDEDGLFTGRPGSILERYSFLSKASDAKALDGGPMYFGNVINNQSLYVRYLGSDYPSAIVTPGRSVASITVDPAVNGTGYAVDDMVTFSPPTGGGITATGKVTAVTAGEITAVAVVEKGTGYDAGQVVVATAITSTAGTGADLTKIVATLDSNTTVAWGLPVLNITTGAPSTYASMNSIFSQSFEGGEDGGLLDVGDLQKGWDLFKDAEEVDVSLLFLGNAGGDANLTAVANYVIGNIVEYRRDCVVTLSPKKSDVVDQSQELAVENVVNTRNLINFSSNYAIMDSGWKLQYDMFNDKYRWIPLNADLAGLMAATDNMFDPWWSPAGFNRGKIKNVVALAFNPNKALRDELYKNNVNPVVSFKGDGIVLFGDRTMQAKASAFQYINVRRLFLVLEKAISKAAKYMLFEFNDKFTRAQFRNMVEPYLREVKGRRGIYDFKVICDETNNTPEIIDRAEFVASILVKPARSINFITLNFVAVRTGVAFDEVVGAF